MICRTDESGGAALSFRAGGELNWGLGPVLLRAAGERFRWEAWMVLVGLVTRGDMLR